MYRPRQARWASAAEFRSAGRHTALEEHRRQRRVLDSPGPTSASRLAHLGHGDGVGVAEAGQDAAKAKGHGAGPLEPGWRNLHHLRRGCAHTRYREQQGVAVLAWYMPQTSWAQVIAHIPCQLGCASWRRGKASWRIDMQKAEAGAHVAATPSTCIHCFMWLLSRCANSSATPIRVQQIALLA